MERSSTSDADLTQDLARGEIVDGRARPYFLSDVDMTLEEFRLRLRDPDPEVRAYLVGKLLRQAPAPLTSRAS